MARFVYFKIVGKKHPGFSRAGGFLDGSVDGMIILIAAAIYWCI
jgi:hypothetical protein